LRGIPGVLIHGRLDLGSPLTTAWELRQAWADTDLVVIDAGHTGSDATRAEVLAATERFKR
jgi:proline iminopeptidase